MTVKAMRVTLTLHTRPEAPLEAECITPQRLAGLSEHGVENLGVMHGNRKVKVGDFFRVSGSCEDEVHLEGDLGAVKLVGSEMSAGRIVIDGNIGMHVGCGMSGGEITVNGDASDWVGPAMSGGRIVVKGDAGHLAGSAYRGQAAGMHGGEILIHGSAGNEIGGGMRRGLIAVGGNTGDFTGVNMLAGTVVVFGELGIRTGAGMKRGSVVAFRQMEILPTFEYVCAYHPVFLRCYLLYLRALGFAVEDAQIRGKYRRWSGDGIELNRGEILLFDS